MKELMTKHSISTWIRMLSRNITEKNQKSRKRLN